MLATAGQDTYTGFDHVVYTECMHYKGLGYSRIVEQCLHWLVNLRFCTLQTWNGAYSSFAFAMVDVVHCILEQKERLQMLHSFLEIFSKGKNFPVPDTYVKGRELSTILTRQELARAHASRPHVGPGYCSSFKK